MDESSSVAAPAPGRIFEKSQTLRSVRKDPSLLQAAGGPARVVYRYSKAIVCSIALGLLCPRC